MSKLKAGKKTVVLAVIEVNDALSQGSQTNAGHISFHTSREIDSYSRVLGLAFQRNRMDATVEPFGGLPHYSNIDRVRDDQPPNDYDFGPFAYGRFYAGHVDLHRDVDADLGGVKQLEIAAKLLQKLVEAIKFYNIDAVTRDELKRFELVCEKLGVEVMVKRYHGSQRFEFVSELSQKYQLPAVKLLNKMTAEAEAKDETPEFKPLGLVPGTPFSMESDESPK